MAERKQNGNAEPHEALRPTAKLAPARGVGPYPTSLPRQLADRAELIPAKTQNSPPDPNGLFS